MLLREMMSAKTTDWDEPLDSTFLQRWTAWVDSLHFLEDLRIPRMYSMFSIMEATRVQVHVFADASKDAIAAVAYLKVWKEESSSDVSFLFGKANVAPSHGHTIPRLELCSAVLAVELAEFIKDQLGLDNNDFWFYTDSQVALGYIANDARRFYVYVVNRVSRIRTFIGPDHWRHISTNQNPADLATRTFDAQTLPNSIWINGPDLLHQSGIPGGNKYSSVSPVSEYLEFPVMLADWDKEVRPTVSVNKSHSVNSSSRTILPRLEKFSRWSRLVIAISILQHVVKSKKVACKHSDRSWHYCPKSMDVGSILRAKTLILKTAQEDAFAEEIRCLARGLPISKNSSILSLSPFLDSDGVLHVGGRIAAAKSLIDLNVHPIIIPKKSHVAVLLIRHCHDAVFHQGRHLTEGKLRSEGYWIIGAKRLVSSEIYHCVTCRKLRGPFCGQKMASLPADRLTPGPPFTFVGVDTFGPSEVTARRTRGGVAKNKRWAILFTCLVSRGIHIEVIEELSTSSFINALRRFLAVRGPVRQFRSDRGTNFVGAVNELKMCHQFVESQPVQKFLRDNTCSWLFNPPYASHFGGSWERMIGVVRRILDGVLLQNGMKNLTHETLSTFLAEVCAIVNSRPLTPITEDAGNPTILTPNMILTHKMQNLPEAIPPLDLKEMYKSQWRHVQVLADTFWKRWEREYISSLQPQRKWMSDQPDLKVGDVVLMKDVDLPRNMWPMAVVNRIFPSSDGHIREVEIRVNRDNHNVLYTRPVHKLVPLICQ